MNVKTPCLLAGCLSLLVLPIHAADNDERLKKVIADVQAALDASKPADAKARSAWPGMGAGSAVAQLLSGAGQEDTAYRESALTQLAYALDPGPVRQECLDLAADLRREREAGEKKMLADIDTAIDRATSAVRAAKTAADLDPIVGELGKFRSDRGEMMYARSFGSALSRAQATLRFVTEWQDYLSDVSNGETEQVVQVLRGLAQQEIFLIPRSEILERMRHPLVWEIVPSDTAAPTPSAAPSAAPSPAPLLPAPPSISELVTGIKTLDDIAPALDAFDKISRDKEDLRQPDAAMAIKLLTPFDQSFREFRAGQSTKVEINAPALPTAMGYYDASSRDAQIVRILQRTLLSLRDQLLALTLPRYLDLPSNVTARPGEGPIDFLDRRKAEALASGDYVGAAKADEARSFLRAGGNQNGAETSQAAQFIIADRQETARQFALAVSSYERALATGTNLIPAKIIGDRLDAIKTAHPQEYQQGLDLYLSPPAPRGYPYAPYGPYGPTGTNAMNRRNGFPNGQPEPTPTPSLTIPAASPSPK